MAYTPTTWADRNVERARTYTSVTNLDGSITFTPSPGTIYSVGTEVTASRMNKIETELVDASNSSKSAGKIYSYNNIGGAL